MAISRRGSAWCRSGPACHPDSLSAPCLLPQRRASLRTWRHFWISESDGAATFSWIWTFDQDGGEPSASDLPIRLDGRPTTMPLLRTRCPHRMSPARPRPHAFRPSTTHQKAPQCPGYSARDAGQMGPTPPLCGEPPASDSAHGEASGPGREVRRASIPPRRVTRPVPQPAFEP